MKNMKRILGLCLVAAMVMAMSVTAFAVDAPAVDSGKAPGLGEDKTSQSVIPVTVNAKATTFDVDVPTSFPTEVDPETGETVQGDPTITNNSYGALVVTNVTVKDNAAEGKAATWHLAAFDKDMSQVEVDSNLIGLSVSPKKVLNKGEADEQTVIGTALKTTDENAAEQVLLDGRSDEWVINGKTATDGSNVLSVVYDTNVSAVSADVTNEVAANIVLTIAWNTKA